MNQYTAAVVQPDIGADPQKNLEMIKGFVEEAARHGAKLVVLPEMSDYVADGCHPQACPGGPLFRTLSPLAKKDGIWIFSGSVREENPAEPARPYNTAMVINPQGECVAKYSKLHPADIKFGGVKESATNASGHEVVTVPTGEVGTLGLSICYDIRFPELYRLCTLQGAQVLVVGAMFMMITGKDHWETLLRARAIENGCYVLASDQIGTKTMGNTFMTYGNSMIIDPWGTVIARASDRPGVIYAEIDLDFVEQIRDRTGFLDNRRQDIYDLRVKSAK